MARQCAHRLFVAILVQCWITGKTGFPAVYWLLAPIALFVVLVIAHRRVVTTLNMTKRAVSVYSRGLARMEDRWAGSGETGEEFKDPLHLYAEDLDILGEGSLFQLLSTARTNMGKQCLARWLLNHADVQEIQNRQAAVAELKPRLDFREDLAVSGESERIAAKPEALIAWAREESGLQRWPLVGGWSGHSQHGCAGLRLHGDVDAFYYFSADQWHHHLTRPPSLGKDFCRRRRHSQGPRFTGALAPAH